MCRVRWDAATVQHVYIFTMINSDLWVTFNQRHIVQRIVELLLVHLLICWEAQLCVCHKHSASELSVHHLELMSEIRLRQSYFTKGKHENMLIYSMFR